MALINKKTCKSKTCFAPIFFSLIIPFFIFSMLFSFSTEAIAFCFSEAGASYGISPQLLKGIAKVESNLNPKAINRNLNGSVVMGLMQINSSWINRLNLDPHRLLTDPCYNVATGSKILQHCIDKHGYTWEAVGCYNAVSRHKRIDYSWRVFEILKAEQKNTPKTSASEPSSYALKASKKEPGIAFAERRQTLTFTVKDNAAIE